MADNQFYYSYLETDLSIIRQNYRNLQNACRQQIIPVAKGNAWVRSLINRLCIVQVMRQ